MEKEDDNVAILNLSLFYWFKKQILLLDTYYITYLLRWVCVHCTVAVPDVHCTTLSQNLTLKVDFLFQRFLVLTV